MFVSYATYKRMFPFGCDTVERVILHVDANSFYASVECLYYPDIRDKSVAVGGDVEARHGIILTKNQIASSTASKPAKPSGRRNRNAQNWCA